MAINYILLFLICNSNIVHDSDVEEVTGPVRSASFSNHSNVCFVCCKLSSQYCRRSIN